MVFMFLMVPIAWIVSIIKIIKSSISLNDHILLYLYLYGTASGGNKYSQSCIGFLEQQYITGIESRRRLHHLFMIAAAHSRWERVKNSGRDGQAVTSPRRGGFGCLRSHGILEGRKNEIYLNYRCGFKFY